jgi:fatty acid desaturase
MVKSTEGKSRGNPEAKFIRLQEIGLAHFLAWLPALILLIMFNLTQWLWIMSVLLILSGWVFFCFGLVGRQELAEKRQAEEEKPPDCPKS